MFTLIDGELKSEEHDLAVRLAESLTAVDGLKSLAPGVRDLVASATAKVLGRKGSNSDATGVEVKRHGKGPDATLSVRIDCHLGDSRSASDVVDEIYQIVEEKLGLSAEVASDPRLDIDLRIISRGPSD